MSKHRLATNKQKILLEIETKGECEICGQPADEVHHITPFSEGGETIIGNLQYLCKECHKDQHRQKTKIPYRGQSEAWEKVPKSPAKFDLIKMPTGYGKTITGIGLFKEMVDTHHVSRVLIAVSSRIQANQWVHDIIKESKSWFDAEYKVVLCENLKYLLRLGMSIHKNPHFYVATYQTIAQGQTHEKPIYTELTKTGKWLVICDEAHHLAGGEDPGQSNVWSQFLDSISFEKAVYLSATPHRHDRVPLKGIKYIRNTDGSQRAIDLVEITTANAFQEEVIRKPIGHIQHYFVDIDSDDGPMRITTETLRELGYSDFSDFEKTKRGLRYNSKYLIQILVDAMDCLRAKNNKQPKQHQMLVYCMTCKHAKFITEFINQIEANFADWIGENEERDDKQNDSILKKYKENKLQCLVNVNKANEGFNNARTSVEVFLNLSKSSPQTIQQIGRALRRNRQIRYYTEDVADLFASADTNIADEILKLEGEWNDVFKSKTLKPRPPRKWPPDPQEEDIYDIIDAEFYKQDDVYLKTHLFIPKETLELITLLRKSPDPLLFKYTNMSETEIYMDLRGDKTEKPNLSINEERVSFKEKAKDLRGDIASLWYEKFPVLREPLTTSEEYNERTRKQKQCFYKKLNGRWKYHYCGGKGIDSNIPEELEKLIPWLDSLYQQIRTEGEFPQWLQP